MKKLSKKSPSSYHIYILLALLFIGLIVAIFEINKQQNLNSAAQMAGNCTVPDVTNTPEEQMVLDRINAIRQQRNLMPIVYNEALKRPSKWYANDLARGGNSMPPIDSLGRDVVSRFSDCGIMTTMQGEEIGESVRVGPTTVEMHMQALQDDQNHVFPTFTHAAVSRTGNNWVIVYHEGPPVLTGNTNPPGDVQPTTNNPPGDVQPTTTNPPGGVQPTTASLGGVVPGMPTEPPFQGGQAEQPTPCPSSEINGNNNSNENSFEDNHKKKKNKKGGSSKNNTSLLQQLIKLLEQLIAQLGGTPPSSSGTDQPANPC